MARRRAAFTGCGIHDFQNANGETFFQDDRTWLKAAGFVAAGHGVVAGKQRLSRLAAKRA